jgi:hypothetical protein
MSQPNGVLPRHGRWRVLVLYLAVAVLCAALLGLVGWWYYYEQPNAGSVVVQVWNSSPANATGMAEVWVALDGPTNGTGNPNMDVLSIAPSTTDDLSFTVSGQACQSHSVSLYLNEGSSPQSHPSSTQSVTVCGGDHKLVAFTVTNTF